MNGFWHGAGAALVMILGSELGDRTFFLTALLSAQRGGHERWQVFGAALAALAVVTTVSVGLGAWLVAGVVGGWIPLLGGVVFIVIGILMLLEGVGEGNVDGRDGNVDRRDGLDASSPLLGTSSPLLNASSPLLSSLFSNTSSPLSNTPSTANTSVTIQSPHLANPLQVSGIIFVAEWGDRSQLAIVALAANEHVGGVLVGALAGHAVCTAVACLFGAVLGERVGFWASKGDDCYLFLLMSVVNMIGACLFIVYGVITLLIQIDEMVRQ